MAKPKLTVKQAKFVKAVAEGKTKRDAAQTAGYSGSPETLSVTASEVLKKPNVQEALQEELARQGITLEKIIKPVANALNHDDVDTQLKGHDRAVRLIMPKGEGANININFNQHIEEKKQKYDF